jgi:hypothetical protein
LAEDVPPFSLGILASVNLAISHNLGGGIAISTSSVKG